MTVSLCIRQGSKRNDDSVSVEELDWSAESQVLIPAEHLLCDFKSRPWAKNSSPNTNDLNIVQHKIQVTQFPCTKCTQNSAMFKFIQRTCPSLLNWCKKQTWIPLLFHFVFVAWAHFIHWWLVFLAFNWGVHADLYVVLFTEFNFIQFISSVFVSHCQQLIKVADAPWWLWLRTAQCSHNALHCV